MKTRRQLVKAAPSIDVAAAMSDDEASVASQEDMFTFNGKNYSSYQEMVEAKRQRNRDVLLSSGLLEAKAAVDNAAWEEKRTAATARGLKRTKTKAPPTAPLPRRKSSRLSGNAAPGIQIENESGGKFEISGGIYTPDEPVEPTHYNNRVNDGSDLTIAAAVEETGPKWVKEGTVAAAEQFMGATLADIIDDLPIVSPNKKRGGSPTSVGAGVLETSSKITSKNLQSHLDALSLDDPDTSVAKVVPQRIMSVACHPSPDKIIACAGDKQGHLGIWNVNAAGTESANDGVCLFKPHGGAISTLAWNPAGTSLLSASYDGSVRLFDANKQVFQEIFATYSDDEMYKHKLGYGTGHGYNSWVQSLQLDHRYDNGKCFFLSTSQGTVMHVDLRSKGKVTFNQEFSPRKINTVSLHCDGNIMATAGLAGAVQLWDVRNISSKKAPKPLAWQLAGKSINSAYFSPNGSKIVTTTQADTLDILEDSHLKSGLFQPVKRIRHDNHTGRWLSTFMARWHPANFSGQEMFVVGSLQKPRTIEVFSGEGNVLSNIRGDALTAVASRCCFHPNANKLIVVGGNSSGRVTVAQ